MAEEKQKRPTFTVRPEAMASATAKVGPDFPAVGAALHAGWTWTA